MPSNRQFLKKSIVDTTIAIGTELGEDGLTMRGIASRLGVSATALYQHFESKAAIVREIRLYSSNLLYAEVLGTCAEIENPLARIETAAHRYIVFARTHPWLYAVLTKTKGSIWAGMTQEEIAKTARPLTTFRSWVREGVDKQVLRTDVDPDMEALRLWAALHGLSSMVNSGRIDEGYLPFPVTDRKKFLSQFVQSVVGALVN